MVGGIFSPLGLYVPFMVAGLLGLISIPFAFYFLHEPEHKIQKYNTVSFTKSLVYMAKPEYRNPLIISTELAISTSSLLGILGYFMMKRFASTAGEIGFAFSAQSLVTVGVQAFLMRLLFLKMNEVNIIRKGLLGVAIGFFISCFIQFGLAGGSMLPIDRCRTCNCTSNRFITTLETSISWIKHCNGLSTITRKSWTEYRTLSCWLTFFSSTISTFFRLIEYMCFPFFVCHVES
ncbi:hypothetical protein EWH99_10810 [Sporolactobacillus sp. THM7-7]|nr:hypothetical protein EWH99_10810 [Sporolactobacillus sp. THM7-7]